MRNTIRKKDKEACEIMNGAFFSRVDYNYGQNHQLIKKLLRLIALSYHFTVTMIFPLGKKVSLMVTIHI